MREARGSLCASYVCKRNVLSNAASVKGPQAARILPEIAIFENSIVSGHAQENLRSAHGEIGLRFSRFFSLGRQNGVSTFELNNVELRDVLSFPEILYDCIPLCHSSFTSLNRLHGTSRCMPVWQRIEFRRNVHRQREGCTRVVFLLTFTSRRHAKKYHFSAVLFHSFVRSFLQKR